MIVEKGCGSGPSGSVLLRGLALFTLILLSSVLQASRALKTLAVQPVDMVYSHLQPETIAQGHRNIHILKPRYAYSSYRSPLSDKKSNLADWNSLQCFMSFEWVVFGSSCSLQRRFINRTARPWWASYKSAEFSAHFWQLPVELMPWLFEKPDKCKPSQSSAWTHPRRPDLIRKTRENQVISISSPGLSSVSYFIDIAFIFVLSGRAQPCCRAYKQLYFTGLLCSGVALSFIFGTLWFVSFSLFVTDAHTHPVPNHKPKAECVFSEWLSPLSVKTHSKHCWHPGTDSASIYYSNESVLSLRTVRVFLSTLFI